MDRDGLRTVWTWRAHEHRHVRQRSELAAGAQDVPSFALADVSLQPVLDQDRLEAQYAFIGRPPVRVARKFVEWDQVDLATESPHQLDEPGGVLLCIVRAGQQHVLERQAA